MVYICGVGPTSVSSVHLQSCTGVLSDLQVQPLLQDFVWRLSTSAVDAYSILHRCVVRPPGVRSVLHDCVWHLCYKCVVNADSNLHRCGQASRSVCSLAGFSAVWNCHRKTGKCLILSVDAPCQCYHRVCVSQALAKLGL